MSSRARSWSFRHGAAAGRRCRGQHCSLRFRPHSAAGHQVLRVSPRRPGPRVHPGAVQGPVQAAGPRSHRCVAPPSVTPRAPCSADGPHWHATAGANGLANPRDFLTPVASYEDRDATFTIINKVRPVGEGVRWARLSHAPPLSRALPVRRPPLQGHPGLLPLQCGRVARELRPLQVRPPPLQLHELGHIRPPGAAASPPRWRVSLAPHSPASRPGPVHLHGAHRAHGHAGHCHLRLRHLPAPVDGDGARVAWQHSAPRHR